MIDRRTLVGVAPSVGFAAIALFIGLDLIGDSREGASLLHSVFEGIALLVSVAGAITMYRAQKRAYLDEKQELRSTIATLTKDRQHWQEQASNYLAGLGSAIDQQFSRWSLTSAEKEIALLILKGFSHKEIATLRTTTEQTVRQQATAVYRKAGLQGRADLSAFFLEDLLLPTSKNEEHVGISH